MSLILVTGGTGTLGRAVADRLLAQDHEVRVASRRERADGEQPSCDWAVVDYRTGRGLDAACRGADSIVHCATAVLGGEVRLARAVVGAARRTGVAHLVYMSIVGVDRVPLPYYTAKLAAEREFESSGLPVTILRATQFHDLVVRVLETAARLPVLVLPAGLSFQSVDVTEVAARLAAIATGRAAGRVADFGGPNVRDLRDLASAYLRASGRRRRIASIRLPGKVIRAFRAGEHLAPDHAEGTRTFEEFLRDRVG